MADTSRIDEAASRTPVRRRRFNWSPWGQREREAGLSVGREGAARAARAGTRVIEGLEKDLADAKARDARHTGRLVDTVRSERKRISDIGTKGVKKTAALLLRKNKKLAIAAGIGIPVVGAASFAGGLLRGRQGVKTVPAPPKFEELKIPGRSMMAYQQEPQADRQSGEFNVNVNSNSNRSAPAPSEPQQRSYGESRSYSASSSEPSRGSEGSSMTKQMRNQQRAVRDTKSYLGEAFDATVQRGVKVGRKHLAAMLQRDGLDQDQGQRIMNKFEREIGDQTSLKDFKDKGVTEDYDKRYPGRGKALLEAYRGRYAAGTTMSEMKANANASRS
jgi:hypothetical protein